MGNRGLPPCIALALPFLCIACRREVHVIAELDPNRSVVVYVRPHPPDASVTMALRTGEAETEIYADNDDRWPMLTEVVIVDGVAGVLVCSIWAPRIETAFTLTQSKAAEFTGSVRNALSLRLRERYGLAGSDLLPFAGDPIEWACSDRSGANRRFESLVSSSRRLPASLRIIEGSK